MISPGATDDVLKLIALLALKGRFYFFNNGIVPWVLPMCSSILGTWLLLRWALGIGKLSIKTMEAPLEVKALFLLSEWRNTCYFRLKLLGYCF